MAVDNGSGTLLHGLARLVIEPGVVGTYGWPSFETYPASISLAGGTIAPVDVLDSGAMDLEALKAAMTDDTKLVFLCNPNNPTGGFITVTEMRDFITSIPADVLVVIDEAYREFVTVESVNATIDLVREFPNVAIVRTLSKAYGLAGVRAGYVIAQESIAFGLRRSTVGFALNSVAEAALLVAFNDDALAICNGRIRTVIEQRERMVAALDEHGYSFLPSHSNFIFIHGDVAELTARFEAQGILTRPFPHAGGIRLTIGAPAETDRAISALA